MTDAEIEQVLKTRPEPANLTDDQLRSAKLLFSRLADLADKRDLAQRCRGAAQGYQAELTRRQSLSAEQRAAEAADRKSKEELARRSKEALLIGAGVYAYLRALEQSIESAEMELDRGFNI